MKLNKKTTSNLFEHKDAITNIEGGLSFKLPVKERLINRVLTCFWGEEKFYGNQDNEILKDIEEVSKTDPAFVLQLAIYARNNMYLRTVPQVLLVEASNNKEIKGKGFVRPAVNKIVNRADEIMEVLAYQLQKHKKPIPISLKRGLRDAFGKFNAYQLAKYNREGEVKLVDAMNLIRPIPKTEEQKILYKKIVDDKLESPETWEVILSNWKEEKFVDKRAAWEHIINEIWCKDGKVNNYFAIIRNLRNLLQEKIGPIQKKLIVDSIKNKDAIKNSKMYPFRFYAAYKELEHIEGAISFLEALEEALIVSISNLPPLLGKTFYSSDNSGSMGSPLSEKSHIQLKEIANLMQAIGINQSNDYICSVFGEKFATVNLTKKQSIFDRIQKLGDIDVGHSTNGYLTVQYLLKNKIKVDRIIVFTDEQMYDSGYGDNQFATEFVKYRNSVNKNVFLYVINLSGYGDTIMPVDTPNVALIHGWTERLLEFVNLFEKGKQTMIKEIESVKI